MRSTRRCTSAPDTRRSATRCGATSPTPDADSAGVRAGDDVLRARRAQRQLLAAALGRRARDPTRCPRRRRRRDARRRGAARRRARRRAHGRLGVRARTERRRAARTRRLRAGARPLRDARVAAPGEEPKWPGGITVRDFEPGTDDAAWLRVNNRAFENHPEQGAWIEATLAAAAGRGLVRPFAVRARLRRRRRRRPRRLQLVQATPGGRERTATGRDLRDRGRPPCRRYAASAVPLAIEGLARMHARGSETGSLFTDADNTRAIGLYESLGFAVHRVDRSYARDVDGAMTTPATTRYRATRDDVRGLIAEHGEPRYRGDQVFDGLWSQRRAARRAHQRRQRPAGRARRRVARLHSRPSPSQHGRQGHDDEVAVARGRRRAARDRAHAIPGPSHRLSLVAGRLRDGLHVLRDRPGRLRTSPRCRRDL